MKLNLGCGFDKKDGYVNLDSFQKCNPDVLHDIENIPLPFDDNIFDEILIKHVLEHIGQSFSVFSAVMKDLYRISKPNARITIQVPNYKHISFWADPTHVRAFDEFTFKMMSKRKNDEWIKNNANYTMLSYLMEVDFELISTKYIPSEQGIEISKDIPKNKLGDYLLEKNLYEWNIIREMQVVLKAVK